MRESHSAGEENKETIKEESYPLGRLIQILVGCELGLLQLLVLFAPLKAFLGLHRVYNVRDNSPAHRQWYSLVLTKRFVSCSLRQILSMLAFRPETH